MRKIIILILPIILITGCMQSKPPELKSPCVANDYDKHLKSAPCVRRPVNSNIV
jgi:hypothetical protein